MEDARILFVCTTFPAPTETFLQREVEALQQAGVRLDLVSIWGGGGSGIRCFGLWELVKLVWWIPYWLMRRPAALAELAEAMSLRAMPSALNVGENLLGMAFALIHAKGLAAKGYTHIHGVWGGLPAASAWLLHRLIGLPFSFGGHAYDLFEDGGDWLLREKGAAACWVRTSTEAGRQRLLKLGIPGDRILLLRRGLVVHPPVHPMRPERMPLRILCVGRFVEKMGYRELIRILSDLVAGGHRFDVRIIGEGPTQRDTVKQVAVAGLSEWVRFEGKRPFEDVERALAWADVFLFTGVVARSGDRAGLPNAVAEAMAAGVPVVASPVGGVAEAVFHGETGMLAAGSEAVASLVRLAQDDALYLRLQEGARQWVEDHFDAKANMALLGRYLAGLD